MLDPTDALLHLADARDRLKVEPATLVQLAAQVAVLEAAVVMLADTSPNRDALQRWLQVAGAEAEYDSPAGHAIRAAARLLAERLRTSRDVMRGHSIWHSENAFCQKTSSHGVRYGSAADFKPLRLRCKIQAKPLERRWWS